MSDPDITGLLTRCSQGDRTALEQLMPIVYQELHRIASNRLRSERSGHTLQPTALIHEAYFRLLNGAHPQWENRAHFFGIAARLMRQILTDHARARATQKRHWGFQVTFDDAANLPLENPQAVVDLSEALDALEKVDERKSRVLDLRYFGGLEIAEICAATGIAAATVRRDLRLGEAWLRRQISSGHGAGAQ
jgi:RNA polymerase sigma factor (TIGR02999 family)